MGVNPLASHCRKAKEQCMNDLLTLVTAAETVVRYGIDTIAILTTI